MSNLLSKIWNREFVVAAVGLGAIVYGWSDVAQSEIVSNIIMFAGVAGTLWAKVRS